MITNKYNPGQLDTLIAFYQRQSHHGQINDVPTVTAHTQVRAAIKQNERWKAVDTAADVERALVLEMRYYQEINANTTMIVYQGIHYKVRTIQIIGRRQYIKIMAMQEQN